MTFGLLADLHWLAVIVAALAYFGLGGLWFMPSVFGDAWTRSMGWEPTEDDQPGPEVYLGPLVTSLIATISVALLGAAADVSGVADGIVLGLVTGVGIAGSVLFVTGYFDPKKAQPMRWFLITGGYNALGILVAAVIVSVWQ